MAAIEQFQKEGIIMQPGQDVRYVVTDRASKSCMKRMKITELVDDSTQYDRSKYYDHILRVAVSIFCLSGTRKMYLTG
ncbi:MAG TPA: hypothetical protein VIO58_07355 [Candidatus Methanoperedens sp.]